MLLNQSGEAVIRRGNCIRLAIQQTFTEESLWTRKESVALKGKKRFYQQRLLGSWHQWHSQQKKKKKRKKKDRQIEPNEILKFVYRKTISAK